ncbi:hypothetical protein BDC45DRAFT_569726 [Circinella umbellata]|nr:hypothetical protein BDC45DRAFT_569726 [Circinella umbellata]
MAGADILSQWQGQPTNQAQKNGFEVDVYGNRYCYRRLGRRGVAKSVQCTKYFTDKVKMIVCNKAQLNTFVKTLKPTQEDIKELALPMVQIMGLEAEVSTLELVSSGAYVIQKAANCTIDGNSTRFSNLMEPAAQLLHTIRSFTTTNTINGTSATSWIRNIKETGFIRPSAAGMLQKLSNVASERLIPFLDE